MSYKDTFYQTLVMELNFENQDFDQRNHICAQSIKKKTLLLGSIPHFY